jgi:hypothetical protein
MKALLVGERPPCVSLYLPTHRGGSEEDPIRWKNLLRQAEELLAARNLRSTEIRELLEPAHRLLTLTPFWKNLGDGLAFFCASGLERAYRLPLSFPEMVVVADHFHVKPLLPLLSGDGRFYVLALSQNRVRVLQGSRHSIQELDPKGVPPNLLEALKFHDRDEPLMFHTRTAGGTGSWGAIFHGQGVGIDDHKDDLVRYFQAIDRGLHDLLREEKAPLVLAAVEYLWPLYRRANSYPHLFERGLPGNPDRLSAQELHEQAWAVVQPHFQEARRKAAAMYTQLAGTGRTCGNLEDGVRAAHEGQVEVLLVAANVERWGQFDPSNGTLAVHNRAEAGDDDLLNIAAVHTVLHGGTVYAVPADEVPGGGYLAAICWRPFARKQL